MDDYLFHLSSSQTFLTILSGTFVYILSQFFMEFIIVPRKDYKKIIEQVIYHVKMYSVYYNNPYDLVNKKNNIRDKYEYENASSEIRKVGAELSSYIGIMSKIRVIRRKRLLKVQDALIDLSRGFFIYENHNPKENNKAAINIIENNLKY